MATYEQIKAFVKEKYDFVPKSCWIADAKEKAGLEVHRAWNRVSDERKNPCPQTKLKSLLDAFKHFKMIP
jgi:23S rRNA (uracil1939-C5)-methyltransferase